MTNKLCLAVCENLKREIAAVLTSEEFADVKVVTFPAHCSRPQMEWNTVRQAIRVCKGEGCQIHLLGGCCLAGITDLRELECCHPHKMDQCFYLFANRDIVNAYLQQGAYLLTPGWLEGWRRRVEEWGFDRQTAREYFGESTTRLVLLDTGVDPASITHLQEFADFVRLPYQVVPVGLDLVRLFVAKIILESRIENEKRASVESLSKANRQSADYAMAFDLIGHLTGIMSEEKVIETMLELFSMLFAPEKLVYLPLIGDEPAEVRPCLACPESPAERAVMQKRLADTGEGYAWTESRKGFLLQISHRGETEGILEIDGIAFPEYKEHYLSLALTIGKVCGLAVSNARNYKKIQYLAETDELTGANNRRHFFALGEHELKVAQRYGHSLSALMLDIDHFKTINDTYGHAIGDVILRTVARRCRQNIRDVDILGRYGGEEFAILLPETDLPAARQTAERLRQSVAETPVPTERGDIAVTISLGVARATESTSDVAALLDRADAALYAAKRAGRNCVMSEAPLAAAESAHS
jgi:diguanylate cyclase (GGDEF)-like protein